MVFLHQLKLLLWKNYTLKLRAPWVLLLELTIPLVLFLILLLIRQHKPPYIREEESWNAQPLPSAGVIPLLQGFCRSGPMMADKKGYEYYPNASVLKFLNDIADLSNTPVFDALMDLQKLEDDLADIDKDPDVSPDSKRIIHDFKFRDLISQDEDFREYLVRNLTMPAQLADALLNSTISGTAVSSLLLEKNYDFMKDLTKNSSSQSTKFVNLLQKSVILQALFDPASLTQGPTWLRILSQSANIGISNFSAIDDAALKEAVMNHYLSPVDIRSLSCDARAYSQLFVDHQIARKLNSSPETPETPLNHSYTMVDLQRFVCNMSEPQLQGFSSHLKDHLNWTKVISEMKYSPSLSKYAQKVEVLQHDLDKVGNLEEAFKKLAILASDLNFNLTLIGLGRNDSQSKRVGDNANQLWDVLVPILCGTAKPGSRNLGGSQGSKTASGLPDLLSGYRESTHALRVLLHALTNNPMILYAPNGTVADKVVRKAAHLLEVMKASKEGAKRWLFMSEQFQKILREAKTQSYLRVLQNYSLLQFSWAPDPNYGLFPKGISYEDFKNQSFFDKVNQSHVYTQKVVADLLVDANGNGKVLNEIQKIDYVAKSWLAVLEPMKLDLFYGFPNETMMEDFLTNRTGLRQDGTIIGGVIFDNLLKDGSLPKHIHYRIRQDSRLLPSTHKVRSRYWFPGPGSGNSYYYYFGFVWIQDSIERALIDLYTGKNVTAPGVYIQQMPYPCYLKDDFLFVIQYIMPLCVIVSFIYSVAILTQNIVHEKEQRLKEVMKMMGLSNAVHWTSWFITSMVTMILIVMSLTLILKHGHIVQYSNSWIVFTFLALAAIATTMFCFFLSTLFSKAKLAASCSGIIYFVTYMPYVFISIQEGGSSHLDIDGAYKTFASLFSTTALGLGARYFAFYEQNGAGVQWNTLATSPLEGDTFSLAQVFTMLIVDAFLYGILTWYIEAVFPGMYGLPRPWYFPLQTSYWCGSGHNKSAGCWSWLTSFGMYERLRQAADDRSRQFNTDALLAMEPEPSHLNMGVVIDGLTKVYRNSTLPAVDNLSLKLYEGQITSFLGHNGAGKTTTMSLLTGLFPSTSGTAYICGYDIHTDMERIRTSLGLCPQHNVLFDRLTVEEHLWFYARLKGMPGNQVLAEMDDILADVGLPEKRHSRVETLSGGMKRKLSVAMAFVGGSKTVILDEPTAGVDPYARRAIWELLAKYKHGRTILLSTHFMDEADILGDRIAIISHGKLRCVGSPLFLKSRFGDGYHLTMVKDKTKGDKEKIQELVTNFIQRFHPSAVLVSDTLHELSYVLPDKGKEKKNMLGQLFEKLEDVKEELGCSGFGLLDTTLEEVFLKVTEATMGDEDIAQGKTAATMMVSPSPSSLSPVVVSPGELRPPARPAAAPDIHSPPSIRSSISSSSSSSAGCSPAHGCQQGAPRKPVHRRSLSSDSAMSRTNQKSNLAVRTHRRTGSGGFFHQHRRTHSTDGACDLTFMLNASNLDRPETIKKVTEHRRMPSGVAQVLPIGGDTWTCHTAGTTTVSPSMLRWQQFYGLLIKRWHHGKRNMKGFITNIILPCLFISIAMTVALAQPKALTSPPLVLSPTMFHPPPYYVPFMNYKEGATYLAARMENTLALPSGIGADCVLKDENSTLSSLFRVKADKETLRKLFDPFCSQRIPEISDVDFQIIKDVLEGNVNPRLGRGRPKCHCSKARWEYVCDPGVEGNPAMFGTVTGDTMINITDRNFMKYLLYTTTRFRRKRYGALTFGDVQNVVPSKVASSRIVEVKKLYVRDTARVWFSNKGYHAMPAFINAMDNAILRANLPPEKGNPASYGITVVSHPLNLTSNVLNWDQLKQGTDAVIAIFVIIAMSFVPASFVIFLVTERSTNAKHIQFVSGVSPALYWLSNLLWDLLNYMVPAIACMLIFFFFNVPAYVSRDNFKAVCALFMCYGWSITPMMYPFSFIFKEPSTAYVVLIILNLFLGITCTVTTSILQLFPNDPQLVLAYNLVRVISLLFPNYCLGRSLMDLAYNEVMNEAFLQMGAGDKIHSPFEWKLVSRNLVCMLAVGVVCFVLTLVIEYRNSFRWSRKCQVMEASMDGDDVDVGDERQRVLSGGADDDLLRVENLTKVYNSSKTGKHMAVNKLCLGVAKGECFGLLGVNGAGKSTTFKMLTGETSVTAGDAFMDGSSVVSDILKVHKQIGYCPQFDALLDELTAEEHLYLYARLRGIPETECAEVVNWAIKKMALTRYAKMPSRTYSGGNKRKLSAAIAMIGNPSLIFMDEPTTGMDPAARRFLWNVILSIIAEGNRSVILTSHSMEECEALCTRLAIMVNGQFQCLGSPQHLKNRFGDGYIVTLRVKGNLPDMHPLREFFEDAFPSAVLKECHHNMLQYQIPSLNSVALADLFSKLEGVSESLHIEDYSVSQTSLDNVFINFAKYQTDAALKDDPPLLLATYPSLISRCKSRWRAVRQYVSSKRRRVRFTQLLKMTGYQSASTGSIGVDEEEVSLDGIDPTSVSFLGEHARLRFDVEGD